MSVTLMQYEMSSRSIHPNESITAKLELELGIQN